MKRNWYQKKMKAKEKEFEKNILSGNWPSYLKSKTELKDINNFLNENQYYFNIIKQEFSLEFDEFPSIKELKKWYSFEEFKIVKEDDYYILYFYKYVYYISDDG